MEQPIAAAAVVGSGVEAERASTNRMTNDPTDAAGSEKINPAANTAELESSKKIDCICDALYVLPRIRKLVPLWYPDKDFKCEHESICHRLTDLQLIRIGDVHWKCVDSAPLIETEHCYPTSNATPSACPCAHDHLIKMQTAGRFPALTTCEDWKSNPKAIELLSKAPLTASQWKTFKFAELTTARDTNTISSRARASRTPRARASTSQKPPLVHKPWLSTTGSTSRENQPWLHSLAGPMTLSIDSLQRAKLAKPIREPDDFPMAPPIFHLGEASPSRASDARREVSLPLDDFSYPSCQAQNNHRPEPVVHSQSGSIFWQNSNHQPVRPASRFDPFGQVSGISSQQETESLDAIERRAALFGTGVQSFSDFVKEVTEHFPAAVQDQTQTRPPILHAAGSGSKRKADQMTPDLSSQSLLEVGSLSYAARFGIDAETIAAAAQCPVTPARQVRVVDPASAMTVEVLPASYADLSSLGSLTDQMPEYPYANDESATADQAPEPDQTLIEPPDEWAWRFL